MRTKRSRALVLAAVTGLAALTATTAFAALIEGTDGDDQLMGTPQGDLILAKAGNDGVVAAAGNDGVDAGDGNDSVLGNQGRDNITGGPGDVLDGGEPDIVFGQDGNDNVLGRQAGDEVRGRSGDDVVRGGRGATSLAGVGVDTTFGGPGADVMFALAKADAANPGGDTLFGGRGNDVIRVSDGETDRVDCGRGRRDRAIVDPGDLDQLVNCEIVIPRPPREEEDDGEVTSRRRGLLLGQDLRLLAVELGLGQAPSSRSFCSRSILPIASPDRTWRSCRRAPLSGLRLVHAGPHPPHHPGSHAAGATRAGRPLLTPAGDPQARPEPDQQGWHAHHQEGDAGDAPARASTARPRRFGVGDLAVGPPSISAAPCRRRRSQARVPAEHPDRAPALAPGRVAPEGEDRAPDQAPNDRAEHQQDGAAGALRHSYPCRISNGTLPEAGADVEQLLQLRVEEDHPAEEQGKADPRFEVPLDLRGSDPVKRLNGVRPPL